MNTKLTLNIDKTIIRKAKKYAISRHISLSKLVEEYLKSVSSTADNNYTVAPITIELSKLVKKRSSVNYKKTIEEILISKHVR